MTNPPTQEPTPPSTPATNAPAGYAPAAVKPATGLAIAALIVGIFALFTGWVPFWGIIAGSTAIVLGAIALRKHQSKGLSITGIILGGFATLTSLITTLILIVGIAAGPTTSLTSGPEEATQSDSGAASSSEPAEPGAKEGTRDNPAPIGTTLTAKDWTVVINSYNPDGNAVVAGANSFNPEPDPGTHYEIVNYTVTYTGSDSAYAAYVSVDLVTDTGEVVNSAFTILDDSFGLDELYAGGTVTGSEAYMVKDGATVTIRVTPDLFGDDTFFATK